jgi:hypothetical protein
MVMACTPMSFSLGFSPPFSSTSVSSSSPYFTPFAFPFLALAPLVLPIADFVVVVVVVVTDFARASSKALGLPVLRSSLSSSESMYSLFFLRKASA